MFPLVESIKIFAGEACHLVWHQKRFERSYRKYYKSAPNLNISEILKIPSQFTTGLVKARFLYNSQKYKFEFHRYQFRKIRTLKIVYDDQIDYHLKWTDRKALQDLFARRDDCDDILIVKNGFFTDSYSANILFYNGQKWLTPSTPLLAGTTRARLLDNGDIEELPIRTDDLKKFTKFQLINAMLDFDKKGGKPIKLIQK